jgi:hypothetical protein
MSDEPEKNLTNQYIETLVAIKTSLSLLHESQKALHNKICQNLDEQSKQLISMAADIRLIRERFANIDLRNMMLTYKNGTNGNSHTQEKSSKKNGKDIDLRKQIKEHLDTEEELEKELLYRSVGKLISNNWKFILIVFILALIGVIAIFFGPDWVDWLKHIPLKK